MNRLAALLGALLIATNTWWFYRAVDQGLKNISREQERYEAANRVVALSALASEAVSGKSKPEVEALLKKLFPDEELFEKEGALNTTWLALPIARDGRVAGVRLDEGTKALASYIQPARATASSP